MYAFSKVTRGSGANISKYLGKPTRLPPASTQMDLNNSTLAQPPDTPRKQQLFRGKFDALFMKLSATYNLGFTLPDPTKSPTKRRRVGDRVEDIYWRLTYQHHQGCLPDVLNTFRKRAMQLSSKWTPEPHSSDLAFMVTGLQPATTSQEREDLVKLLQDVLQEFRPLAPPVALGANISRSSVPDSLSIDPESSRSIWKRPSHAPHQPPPKRTKNIPPDSDAVSQGIFVTGPVTRSATKTSHALSRQSMQSSKTSCSVEDTVFSYGVSTPFSVQTTNEASSQEQKRLPHHVPSSHNSYKSSFSSRQALSESITALPEEPSVPELPPCPENDSSDWSDSGIDSFPATAVDSLMRKVAQLTAEPAKSPAEVLEESLDSVWRESLPRWKFAKPPAELTQFTHPLVSMERLG